MVLDKGVNAVVVQADGIEQAGTGLDGPPGLVANSWGLGQGLRQYAAEPGEIDEIFHLPRVAECAGGGEDGVAKSKAAQRDSQVNFPGRICSARQPLRL